MKKYLSEKFAELNIDLTPAAAEAFEKYYNLLLEWNAKFNLTAITSQKDVCDKHFTDSVLCSKYIPENSDLLDIGAGAGFPSVPLKIIRPDLKITMLDSVNKKVMFLKEVISVLGLKDVKALHSRCEDYARGPARDSFDVVTGRAVARLNTLCEYSLPLVRPGGLFISYKSENIEEELLEAEKAISLLKGRLVKTVKAVLPGSSIVRTFVIIEKTDRTPSLYPRGKGKERSNPIV